MVHFGDAPEKKAGKTKFGVDSEIGRSRILSKKIENLVEYRGSKSGRHETDKNRVRNPVHLGVGIAFTENFIIGGVVNFVTKIADIRVVPRSLKAKKFFKCIGEGNYSCDLIYVTEIKDGPGWGRSEEGGE